MFPVRNSFYLGAYQAAIAEAADLDTLSDKEKIERDVFVYRAYIELGSYEVNGSRDHPILIVGIDGFQVLSLLHASRHPVLHLRHLPIQFSSGFRLLLKIITDSAWIAACHF
jgi:hypothetical protein